MPLDDFDLSPDAAADPLDVSGFGATPPFVPQQQKRSGFDMKDIGPLLALIPMAAKGGGMGAVGALLQGFQRRRQMRAQEGRLAAQDERQAGLYRMTEQRNKDAATNAAAQRKQQFMGQFNTALGQVDSPEAVRALLDFYGGQSESFGVARPDLERFAMQIATPDSLTTKKVNKRWNAMSASEKELAQRTGVPLQIDGQTIPFQQWSSLVGGIVDPTTGAYPQAAPKPNVATPGSFEEYVGLPQDQQALRRQQRKDFMQADDRPQPQATVLIRTVDENGRPVQRFVSKQPGAEFSVAPTASQQTAMAEQEAGIQLIADIDSKYRPEYVGPVVARAMKAKMVIPGADVPQDVAEFYASVAGLRNEIIRLMSGAAVSGSEEARMRAQLPDVTDKPSVFQAKMNQTRRNREVLLQRTQARSGGAKSPGMAPMPSHEPTGGSRKIGRFDVTVEP